MSFSMMAQVIGIATTLNNLNNAKSKVENSSDIFMQVAQQVEAKAKELAPVRTGYLRDHISSHPIPKGAEVVSEAPYSIYQELGTRYMRAHPYMKPACEAAKNAKFSFNF